MSDLELLKAAARAAGVDVWLSRMADGHGGVLEPCHTSVNGETVEWNPLTDNSDAFALMVKLGIDVWRRDIDHEILAVAPMLEPFVEPIGMDPESSTRRAIVRAAAAMGGAA